jgi:large subunit ribosomal protein L54
MNKKQRKRHEKKMAALATTLPPKIPLHEQAIDITPAAYNQKSDTSPGMLTQAAERLEARSQITKSARQARRNDIREANFLRGL